MAFDSTTAQNTPGISTTSGGSALENTQIGPGSIATISSQGGNEAGAKITDQINAYVPPPAPPETNNGQTNTNLSGTMTGTTVNPTGGTTQTGNPNQNGTGTGTTGQQTTTEKNQIGGKNTEYKITAGQQTLLNNFDTTRQ